MQEERVPRRLASLRGGSSWRSCHSGGVAIARCSGWRVDVGLLCRCLSARQREVIYVVANEPAGAGHTSQLMLVAAAPPAGGRTGRGRRTLGKHAHRRTTQPRARPRAGSWSGSARAPRRPTRARRAAASPPRRRSERWLRSTRSAPGGSTSRRSARPGAGRTPRAARPPRRPRARGQQQRRRRQLQRLQPPPRRRTGA